MDDDPHPIRYQNWHHDAFWSTMRKSLNGKRRATLARILDEPVRPDITWREVESLLLALGVEIRRGKGSRQRLTLRAADGTIAARANMHEPHDPPLLQRGAVRDLRDFLEQIGR